MFSFGLVVFFLLSFYFGVGPEVIDFALRFFGASHPRLSAEQGDAISYVLQGRLPRDLLALVFDIDFLRGQTPPEFLSTSFWSAVWESVLPDAVVAVNTIGAESPDVQALARIACSCIEDTLETGALVVEPGPRDRRVWTALIPRPSVLLIGPQALLSKIEGLARSEDVKSYSEQLQLPCWVKQVASDALNGFACGNLQTSWPLPGAPKSWRHRAQSQLFTVGFEEYYYHCTSPDIEVYSVI